MKELTIEQKAELYDEALRKAKEELDSLRDNYICNHLTKDDIRDMYANFFPELKESEDEKIRKALINKIRRMDSEEDFFADDYDAEQLCNWLEKQGEQKSNTDFSDLRTWKYIVDAVWTEKEGIGQYLDSPFTEEVAKKLQKRFGNIKQKSTDKVESKFKVGDWIIDVQGVSVNQIIGYQDDSYLIKTSCSQFYLPRKLTETNHRLWTIQDAKAGDVLSVTFDEWCKIVIFLSLNNNDVEGYGITLKDGELWFTDRDVPYYSKTWTNCLTPATKEQRDTLMKAIHEAGYEWDAEKKELKKIEQKPAWSEEDEYQINTILHGLDLKREVYKKEGNKVEEERYNTQYNWLKSLRPQNRWKPSDRQMKGIECAIKTLQHQLNVGDKRLNSLYDDLKKLRGE